MRSTLSRNTQSGAQSQPKSEKWGYTVRMLIVFNYRILYTVRKDDVVVLRIVHGSQMTPVPPTRPPIE